MVSMEILALPADAVIVASGGAGLIFGKSTNSMACSASVQSRCFQAGAAYANPEFIQVHPTAIPGADKLRLISESVRGEGGRIWVRASRRISAPAANPGERAILLPRRALPNLWQPRAAGHRHAGTL